MPFDPRRHAARIDAAHQAGSAVARLPLSLPEAAAAQDELTALRLARGARRVGWALRPAGHPAGGGFVRGPLLDAVLLPRGAAVGPHLIQPTTVPGVLAWLTHDVATPASAAEILAAAGELTAALVVVDPVWRDAQLTAADIVADALSIAHVVVGEPLGTGQTVDGLTAGVGGGSRVAVSAADPATPAEDGPLPALEWLAGELARRCDGLRAGDVVLAGWFSLATELARGDEVEARVSHGSQASRASAHRAVQQAVSSSL